MAKKIETRIVKKTNSQQPMTLLRAIENIVEMSRDSHLSIEAKVNMAEEVKFLSESFGITERQKR